MFHIRRIIAGMMLLAGLALIGDLAHSLAQAQPMKKGGDAKPPSVRPKWDDKFIEFNMDRKEWKFVIEWFADQAGMPYSSKYPAPPGTFTFYNPKIDGKKYRQYSLGEVFDLLNEVLQRQTKFTLLRGEQTLTLVPFDEPIESSLIRSVNEKELEQCANTEVVQLMLKLKSLNADEFAPEAKKMLRDIGQVTVLEKANALIMQADAASLRRTLAYIREIDKGPEEAPSASTYTHHCKFMRASEAESALNKFFGPPQTILEVSRPQGPMGFTDPRIPQPPPSAPKVKQRSWTVSSDEATNTVLINGPPDKIAQAKNIMTKLDVERFKGQKPWVVGPPRFQYHELPGGNAELIAKMLAEKYKNSSTIRIQAAGPGRLYVYADPQTHLEINEHVSERPPEPSIAVIRLQLQEASKLADSLKAMFPKSKDGDPFIEADPELNGIRVRGTADQVKEVQQAIKVLDDNPLALTGGVSIINLDKGSAATLAEALQVLIPQLRDYDVKVILPGNIDVKPAFKELPPPNKKQIQYKKTMPLEKNESRRPLNSRLQPVSFQDKDAPPQLSDPQKKDKEQPKTNGKKSPVTITAFGNRLIISSEDPKALALTRELVRLLMNTEAGPGDFQVIRLRNANAVEVAKIFDEAFNGPKTQGGGGGGRGPGGPGGFTGMLLQSALGTGGGSQRADIVRVVADPSTNSLLVRAKPLDLLTMRRLIRDHIDVPFVDNEVAIKRFVLGPLKHANAVEVAEILEKVYQNSTKVNTQPTAVSGGFGFGGFGARPVDTSSSTPKAVQLSIGVDTKTNSLVVACPVPMYKDIEELVKQLEAAHADSKQVVKIVSIKDIDPVIIQQAIDAISGRTTPTMAQQTGTPPGTGFGSQQGTFGTRPFSSPGIGSFPGMFGTSGSGVTPGIIVPAGPGGTLPGVNPGGGGPGRFQGSGFPGGGGGGGPRRGGPGGEGPQSRGPSFFGQWVKDDPESHVLYDPSEDSEPAPAPRKIAPLLKPASDAMMPSLSLVQHTEVQLPKDEGRQPVPMPKDFGLDQKLKALSKEKDGIVTPPRLPVTAEVLPDLGVIVLRANNLQDLEAILQIIELIRQKSLPAAIEIELIPLQYADPTSVTNTLTLLLQRVIIGPYNTTLSPGLRPGVTGVPQQPGVQAIQIGTPQQTLQATQAAQPTNVVLLPQPRLSAILVAASKARMPDIRKEIKRLDVPPTETSRPVAFPLKQVPAARVGQLLINFYADRFPNEPRNLNQIRFTWDDHSNTVYVQAAPADMLDIKSLIERLDTTIAVSTNELQVIPLRNAIAGDLATLLSQAIADGLLPPVSPTTGPLPGGVQQPLAGGQGLGAVPQLGQLSTRPISKVNSIQFKNLKSGVLDDIRINFDPRTNSLLISAPQQTMALVLELVKTLDVRPNATSQINIFQLKRADATQMALTLQQLFLGTAGLGATAGRTGGPGAPGAQAAPTPAGGPGALGTAGAIAPRPLQLTVSGVTPEGAVIIDLRLTVDERTNSLIVAGNPNDLLVIESIIAKLDGVPLAGTQRHNIAIRLRNAQAADVANALTPFLTQLYTAYKNYGQGTNYLELQREVIVVPEPISNSLLVSATPLYFEEVLHMISQLDTTPPQVVIQILVAEVDMTGSHEFGVEIGLQTPVLFNRGIFPDPNFATGSTVSYTSTTVGSTPTVPVLIPPGSAIAGSVNPVAQPGFLFNNPALGLGQNPVVNPSLVGFQGLSNLGVGRVSPTNNIGGFVFSASSGTVNVLVRALQVQSRIEILSRPQLQILDNQTGLLNIGQNIPILSSSNVTATGIITNNIVRQNIGVIMQVTPRITPDGRVLMRVIPEVSSVNPNQLNLGNGTSGTVLNVQHLETTVLANDGETILLGGLITRLNNKTENKVPWLGDLPGVGALFRYRTENRAKTELLIIMTPHIVRNHHEAEKILAEEARRMDWMLGKVLKTHGPANCGPLMRDIMNTEPIPVQPYRIVPDGPTSLDFPPAPRPIPGPGEPIPAPKASPVPTERIPVAPKPLPKGAQSQGEPPLNRTSQADFTPQGPDAGRVQVIVHTASQANTPVPQGSVNASPMPPAVSAPSSPLLMVPPTPLLGGGPSMGLTPQGSTSPLSQGRETQTWSSPR